MVNVVVVGTVRTWYCPSMPGTAVMWSRIKTRSSTARPWTPDVVISTFAPDAADVVTVAPVSRGSHTSFALMTHFGVGMPEANLSRL